MPRRAANIPASVSLTNLTKAELNLEFLVKIAPEATVTVDIGAMREAPKLRVWAAIEGAVERKLITCAIAGATLAEDTKKVNEADRAAIEAAKAAEAAANAPAPKAEEPKAEEPKAEEPKAEEPKAEESALSKLVNKGKRK